MGAPRRQWTLRGAWRAALGALLVWVAVPGGTARADPPGDGPPVRPALDLAGVKVLSEKLVLEAIGKVPAKVTPHWGNAAVARIERLYHGRGYSYARAWFVVDAEDRLQVAVDEGVMHRVIFRGVSSYNALFFRAHLPNDVFHGPTLALALAQLKDKHGMAGVSYRVEDADVHITTLLGTLAPLRVLNILVVSRESFGVDFGVEIDPTYGLLPRASARWRDALWNDDRFLTAIEVSIPYRRYFFDAEPAFQWTHGRADLSYRFPAFASGLLAVALDGSTAVSRDGRSDVGLESYFILRATTFADLAFLLLRFTVTLGVGVRVAKLIDVDEVPESAVERLLVRYGARVSAGYEFSPEVLRRDLRSRLSTDVLVAFDRNIEAFADARLDGQLALRWGLHDLIFRLQGTYLAGAVHPVDEVPLAGGVQRVYFGSRYWARRAATIELAARFALWQDRFKLGVFTDLSTFGRRDAGPETLAVAEGFGPSAHFVLFDQFGLDVYYGFGFSPGGFDHNLSFLLQSVY